MSSCSGRQGTRVTCSSSDGLHDTYLRKFRNEATQLSHLHHPGIVKVVESFEENDTWYYAMEFLEGGSLDEYIDRMEGMSEGECLYYAQQIASALSYLHSRHALHLDLKPSNIMRHADGNLTLIDFGLVKQYTADGKAEKSTAIGLGTPGYAPIEQGDYAEGKKFAPTLDIYAFGATMLKMLTNESPPRASEVLNDGFPEGDLQSKGVSRATIALIRKAMMPMKGDRYQTVDEMLAAIQRAYEGLEDGPRVRVETEEKTNIGDEGRKGKRKEAPTVQPVQTLKIKPDTTRIVVEMVGNARFPGEGVFKAFRAVVEKNRVSYSSPKKPDGEWVPAHRALQSLTDLLHSQQIKYGEEDIGTMIFGAVHISLYDGTGKYLHLWADIKGSGNIVSVNGKGLRTHDIMEEGAREGVERLTKLVRNNLQGLNRFLERDDDQSGMNGQGKAEEAHKQEGKTTPKRGCISLLISIPFVIAIPIVMSNVNESGRWLAGFVIVFIFLFVIVPIAICDITRISK